MNRLQSWFRGCVRTSGLLLLIVVLCPIVLGYKLFDKLMAVFSWFLQKGDSRGVPIITPVEDHQVPAYLQPVVAIRREAALSRNYRGPIAWYFRGNVTLADIVAEFGHAKILELLYGQQTSGIWPDQPMIVFWVPTETFSHTADGSPADLKKEWGLPEEHHVSIGRALVLYLLLLHHRNLTGQPALQDDFWLLTETFSEGYRVAIGYSEWHCGYLVKMRGSDSISDAHMRFFLLGIESARDFSLTKQVA